VLIIGGAGAAGLFLAIEKTLEVFPRYFTLFNFDTIYR